MRALTLHIDGMSCGHCLKAVNRVLDGLDGITVDSVQMGRADLRFDENLIDPDRIAAAVSGEGYPARAEQSSDDG